jgi:hypothetical protein
MEVHKEGAEPWTVTLIDTGDNSMTGGRLGRVAEYVPKPPAKITAFIIFPFFNINIICNDLYNSICKIFSAEFISMAYYENVFHSRH